MVVGEDGATSGRRSEGEEGEIGEGEGMRAIK